MRRDKSLIDFGGCLEKCSRRVILKLVYKLVERGCIAIGRAPKTCRDADANG